MDGEVQKYRTESSGKKLKIITDEYYLLWNKYHFSEINIIFDFIITNDVVM